MSELEALKNEVCRLRRAISPRADQDLVSKLKTFLGDVENVLPHAKTIRVGEVYMIRPREIHELMFAVDPSVAEVASMSRALRALLWEPTARDGERVFYKTKEDYEEDGY